MLQMYKAPNSNRNIVHGTGVSNTKYTNTTNVHNNRPLKPIVTCYLLVHAYVKICYMMLVTCHMLAHAIWISITETSAH